MRRLPVRRTRQPERRHLLLRIAVAEWGPSGSSAIVRHIDIHSPQRAQITALDIETDTERGGLDPRSAPIVAVAIAGNGWASVFNGDEGDILTSVDAAIRGLGPGVLATWNGSRFDLPFLADRASILGVSLGLDLERDHRSTSRHDPLPGHDGGYLARWYGQHHLDAYLVYRSDVGAIMHLPCGLKSLAKFMGLSPVEVDRERIHELTPGELDEYVASDAIMTRELTLRRWNTAQHSIDHLTGEPNRTVATSA